MPPEGPGGGFGAGEFLPRGRPTVSLGPVGKTSTHSARASWASRGVVPGEMEVIAAAVAGVAVVANPAEGRRRLALDRLGPEGEAGDRGPFGVTFGAAAERGQVDGEPVVVIGALGVAFVAAGVLAARQRAGVAVGDVDRVALGDPAQVREDAAVDHVARFVWDRGRDRHDLAGRVDEPGRGRPSGGRVRHQQQGGAEKRDCQSRALEAAAAAEGSVASRGGVIDRPPAPDLESRRIGFVSCPTLREADLRPLPRPRDDDDVRQPRLDRAADADRVPVRLSVRPGSAGGGRGRDGRRLRPGLGQIHRRQPAHGAGGRQREGAIFNAQANHSPLLVTAGQQARAQITLQANLTNRDADPDAAPAGQVVL